MLKSIPVRVEHTSEMNESDLFHAKVTLDQPRQLKVLFPILLDGDLVLSTEHLGPAYLVSVLRNAKACCKIVEVPIEKKTLQDYVTKIVNWSPDIVGISLTTISVNNARIFGNLLKKYLPKQTFILAGGPLATYQSSNLLKLDGWEFLDGLIRGEGEIPMLRFAEAFHTDKNYENVPGLVYRESDKILETPMMAGIANLDYLPDPARDQFEYHHGRLAYLRISTSRGCTSHCTFCNAPHTRNRVGPAIKGWRGQSAKRIVDEIERLYKKYRFNTFDFVDSTFEDPGGKRKGKERIKEIATEILNRNLQIYYNACMQACNWHDEDRPLLSLLWQSGLEKVLIGIESGSEIGLRRWDKRSTVEDNTRAIKLLHGTGIYVAFGFISFHAWSSFEEIRQNNEFLRDNMGHNLRRYTTRLELYPGAEVIDDLEKDNLLLQDYYHSLNPFAYTFVDDRVNQLAASLNRLYGDQYTEDCTIEKEPAVFQFETFDVVLHTYFSRLLRIYHDNHIAKKFIIAGQEEVDRLKSEMRLFNFDLVNAFVDKAELASLNDEYIYLKREEVEQFYKYKINQLRTIQLKVSMSLYKKGYDIRQIQHSVNIPA